ncbi:MAG: FAD-dependent oxidoreductase [Chloroherpetonaceae bacterium]|nr:FAD-dependent oxidoreductase [Chloroherpetonaceae bacterium]MDW8437607.1 FAD-dependent oxidoreductase [Chloroherpetonaceae bacterium]
MKPKSVLVVGAGISGLMAATILKENGVAVTVLDKGRGAGGRTSTRRIEMDHAIARFDHGAQYFTVSDERFAKYVERWLALGIVKPLGETFIRENGEPEWSEETRYIGATGMNAIAKYLAESVRAFFSTRVVKLSCDGKWTVETDAGKTFSADALVLSPPVPQSLELLAASRIALPADVEKELQSIDYHSCIAALMLFDGIEPILPRCGIWFQGEPIAFACDNLRKGISSVPTLTIHAGPLFSAAHWEMSDSVIIEQMLRLLADWVRSPVKHWQAHRWRYAFARTVLDKPFVMLDSPAPLLFIGDGFVAPRIEGAAISGISAATALLERL